jgi:type IV secretion system protein VirB4
MVHHRFFRGGWVNYALNRRKLFLLNTNYADLSFLFTILPGELTG